MCQEAQWHRWNLDEQIVTEIIPAVGAENVHSTVANEPCQFKVYRDVCMKSGKKGMF